MKRPVTVITAVILLIGPVLFGLTELKISVVDTAIPDNRIIASQTRAGNSSAIAMTVIPWTTQHGEGGSNGV